jgi:hypothetical protein
MVTGYQRQHRKSVNYTPIEGSKQEFADDLTKVITYANNYRGILEKLSTAYEQSAIAGMVLIQPYLDYTDDPVNGTLDLKIWSYNSFMCDPYFRDPTGQDANFFWCQQYVSKSTAVDYFPHKRELIMSLSGMGNRSGKFYFLPENYNLSRNDLLTMSYIWYRTKRKKKMLYNHKDGITYEFSDKDQLINEVVEKTGYFEIIEVDVPTWKLSCVLNDQLMYNGANPMGFDECPLIPVYWNWDPHVSQPDLRVRSLTRSMRDTQFLLNRRIILNHDISESSINTGWIYKENSIANPENLKSSGQGYDIIVNQGHELTDIQKIIPNAVPPGDMELANQLADFIFRTSGVNQELMGMSEDSKTGIQEMLRQGAGLVTLQKYFDQWDTVLKQLGVLEQKIIQNKWSPAKIARIVGKEPNPEFMLKTFSKYDVLVSEGLNTTIQQQQEFRQILDLNTVLNGIIPPRFILEKSTLQGKNDLIKAMDEREKAAAEMQKHQQMLEQAKMEAELQLIHARSVDSLAMARERHGRAESNIGLFEERLSEITQNRSMALKNKVEALEKLLDLMHTYGNVDVAQKKLELQDANFDQIREEEIEKLDSKMTAMSNENLLNSNGTQSDAMNPEGAENIRSALL